MVASPAVVRFMDRCRCWRARLGGCQHDHLVLAVGFIDRKSHGFFVNVFPGVGCSYNTIAHQISRVERANPARRVSPKYHSTAGSFCVTTVKPRNAILDIGSKIRRNVPWKTDCFSQIPANDPARLKLVHPFQALLPPKWHRIVPATEIRMLPAIAV